MNKKIKGKCSYKCCKKIIFYYFKKGQKQYFCSHLCYAKSLKGKPSHKKGCKLSETTKKKIAKGLKKYHKKDGIVWNKGKQLVKIRKNAKYYRQNPKYYLRELEQNAIRRKVKRYDDTPERKEANRESIKYKQKITGVGRKAKKWIKSEVKYLEINYKKIDILKMALYLDRSWCSISHKLSRLKLIKNHKWIIK